MDNMLKELFDSGQLTVPESISQMSNNDFVRLAMGGFSNPEEVQKLVLKQIIESAKDTEFGKKYHFQEIKSIEDFQNKIPISEWNDYGTYTERMADGEADILFPGKTKIFLVTTGTTSKPKLVPESELGAIARQVISRFRIFQLMRNVPSIRDNGYIFPLSNAQVLSKTKGSIPSGFASGFSLGSNTSDGNSSRIAYPMAVLNNEDTESRDYLIMRFAIQNRDVAMLVGNNAGRFKFLSDLAIAKAEDFINDIEHETILGASNVDQLIREKIADYLVPDKERADELREILTQTRTLLPKDYWPSLKIGAFWLSSSVGQYVKDLKPILPSAIKYFDVGYGASEGKFNIPSEPDKGDGVCLVHTKHELKNIKELYCMNGHKEFLAQEFIATSKGRDVRLTLCDGELVFAVIRDNSGGDDFRSNISVGGNGEYWEPDAEALRIAKEVVKVMDMKLCGVDLLFGENGFIVGEINSMPGCLHIIHDGKSNLERMLVAIYKAVTKYTING